MGSKNGKETQKFKGINFPLFSNRSCFLNVYQSFCEDENAPPYFIANKGQWNKDVRFRVQIEGVSIWIHDNYLLFDFYQIRANNNNMKHQKVKIIDNYTDFLEDKEDLFKDTVVGQVIKMEFVGCNRSNIELLPSKNKVDIITILSGTTAHVGLLLFHFTKKFW